MLAADAEVHVFDAMPSPGRKLLLAGKSGLNLTHAEDFDVFLGRFGTARAALEPALRSFPPEAIRQWAAGLGVETFIGSSGRVFPVAMKASPLLRAWLSRLREGGVSLHARHRWQGWNAARRAIVWGHTAVFWYPGGTDQWRDDGGETIPAEPVNFLGASK